MKSTLEGHTDCLLTKLEGSVGAHFQIEPTCIIITLQNFGSLRPKLTILVNLTHFDAFDGKKMIKFKKFFSQGGFHFQKYEQKPNLGTIGQSELENLTC